MPKSKSEKSDKYSSATSNAIASFPMRHELKPINRVHVRASILRSFFRSNIKRREGHYYPKGAALRFPDRLLPRMTEDLNERPLQTQEPRPPPGGARSLRILLVNYTVNTIDWLTPREERGPPPGLRAREGGTPPAPLGCPSVI